ncbi:hypothetical protein N7466_010688 [Penicillium verhagenii]|uniref:uncharacterized protein n=1 Tax=Penicillium verhagenii TaxID=1562060 RepID=UPI0025457A15|nr:uncharacterized protein N7466_010688 [Penicillium verhagenii]KAJ5917134.1 hypothetical protein N7466_010688 [Penicillium verhagenii]
MATTRRNGQLWSCEPCRKSKLRCDHASPVCGRCIRRDRKHLCVYHPSPLTRLTQATTARDNPLSLPPRAPKTRENGRPPLTRAINSREKPREKSTPVPPPIESTELSTILDDWCQKQPTVQTPGFLGHTSYNDAFRDSDSGLELGSLSPSPETFAMNIENVQRGARALALLKHLPLYREMLLARYKVWEGWTIGRPITLMILGQTEEMWSSVQCDEADETKQTLLLSKRLFEKQTQPIDIHSETRWTEFVSSVTGRWETLGLLFTLIGLAADSTPRDSGGHRAWRKLGDLATTLFAFGLHQQSTNLPFFLKEIRQRTMIAAYAVDKSGATFLGRPPLISRQYCDLPMPLDLSWDEVLAEPAAREAAIANLTVDGWNKEASFQKGAMGRICLLASIFREKALEFSLGRVTEDLPARVE